jgi:hypothetical protein
MLSQHVWVHQVTRVFPAPDTYNLSMLLFRVAVSAHLMLARPAGVPAGPGAALLQLGLSLLATVVLPALVMAGFFSRLASLGIVAAVLLGWLLGGRRRCQVCTASPICCSWPWGPASTPRTISSIEPLVPVPTARPIIT